MRRRFFVDHFEAGSAVLSGDAAEHLGRVLRAGQGQLYELSDGQRVWLGRVERVALSKRGENRIEFSLVEPIPAAVPRLQIDLLLSIVKFDRLEWCLEKATELGATNVVPLAAARTDKPLIAAAGKRRERWERILLESAQQSRRLRPPVLRQFSTPAQAFAECRADVKVILSERRDAPSFREILGTRSAAAAAALAIGPEGGWTDDELAAARAAKFAEASLGENILRTETAVLASMAILAYALGG
ncbi:MAG TPA: RsmE family RNA methyltransferase [Verrucomicrobiae bacterium]|nr:RsmE family RNA methyltransferase [Verrucomicrobiae bacterium]